MHGGTDFAAPTGTPVLAAGDGILDFVGRNGGYGNFIRVEHRPGLKTAYAHLSRFPKGMHRGKRVGQGQIIGYVGTTGRSTGPHLHYEVQVKGAKQNPLTVEIKDTGKRLATAELARFEAARARIDALRAAAPTSAVMASAKL
jgi:murein DD-endopeptidase MepM/ murein hydrolase activator NlpD